MRTTVSQNQKTLQQQTLAPQMRESLKILQMPSLDLAAKLREVAETNPVVEFVSNPNEQVLSSVETRDGSSGAVTENELDFTPDGQAADRILSADDGYRDYFLGNMENYQGGESRAHFFDSQLSKPTLQQYLLSQLSLSGIPPEDIPLAEVLIGNINDRGYFEGSVRDIQMTSGTSEKKITDTLAAIRELDPKGCGSVTLKECLLSQMDRFDDSPWEDEIRLLVERHLENMAARKTALVCRDLGITESDYPELLAQFRKFSANPGDEYLAMLDRAAPVVKSDGVYRLKNSSPVVPVDIYAIKNDSGRWIASPFRPSFPSIAISRDYEDMLGKCAPGSEDRAYLSSRISEAKILQEALERRKETVGAVAQEILDRQKDFLENGWGALKPLSGKQIAEALDMDDSTVSRAVNGKYVKTPFGVVELKKLFASGVTTESGEGVSRAAICGRIKDLVAGEDSANPLSDDKIMQILNGEGIPVKRRTVAKYRSELGIKTASGRKVR